jgi:hypothetical protein
MHLGPGPGVDDIHARSLRAALVTGETLEITDPGESEDVGVDWGDPRALNSFGEREPAEPWSWHGPARSVTGRTWGGCLEVIEWILTTGRFPFDPDIPRRWRAHHRNLRGTPPGAQCWMDRPLAGERGILAAPQHTITLICARRGRRCRPPGAERNGGSWTPVRFTVGVWLAPAIPA